MERADEGALRPARDQGKRGGGSRRGKPATSGSEERTDLILRVAQKPGGVWAAGRGWGHGETQPG